MGYSFASEPVLTASLDALALILPAAERSGIDLGPFLREEVRAVSQGQLKPGAFERHQKSTLLLEHVIFHGTHDVRGDDFQRAVKAAGGDFNGLTSAHSTTYVLQAPAESFLPLAEQLVRIVTSPKLDPRQMQREVEIIGTESQYFGQGPGFHEHLEDTLLAGPGSRSILGTQRTLNAISWDDLAGFYTRHYTPANTGIVITGGVKREEVLGMLERAVRLPPSLPGEHTPTPVAPPLLPIEQTTRAYFSLIAYGYAVAPRDKGTCPRAAALLRSRLLRSLHIEEPMTMGMEVRCMTLRGNTFLLALAFSTSLNASTLPDRMRLAFARLAKEPPTAAPATLGPAESRAAAGSAHAPASWSRAGLRAPHLRPRAPGGGELLALRRLRSSRRPGGHAWKNAATPQPETGARSSACSLLGVGREDDWSNGHLLRMGPHPPRISPLPAVGGPA